MILKKQELFYLMAGIMLATASCKKNDVDHNNGNDGKVHFTSSISGISTRATGTAWDANDAIGVFSKNAGGTVVDANKKYITAAGNGNFAATGADVINYPTDGSSLTFSAYYPFSAALAGNTYNVDVASQTSPAAIDLMYAANTAAFNQASTTTPNLNFTHQLSKLELTVKAGTGVSSLTGLAANLQNFNTTATFDVSTGVLSAGTTPANIAPNVAASGADQMAAAILLPGDVAGKNVVFTLAGDTYTWAMPTGTVLESGKKYSYTIILQKQIVAKAVLLGTATITNWTDVAGGDVNLNPDVTVTPPTDQRIFLETFGTKDMSTATPTPNRNSIATYTSTSSWDNASYTFSGNGEVRYAPSSVLPTNHIWLSALERYIKIEGINTTDYSNLKLNFDLSPNDATATKPIDLNIFSVRYNGVLYTLPSRVVTVNDVINVSLNLDGQAASATGTLELIGNLGTTTAGATNSNFRLDNVELRGTK